MIDSEKLDSIEFLLRSHSDGSHVIFVEGKSHGAWTLTGSVLLEMCRLARLGIWAEQHGAFLLNAAQDLYRPDRPLHRGLDPTFYHTLTCEGDLELINKTKDALASLPSSPKEKQNAPGS